MAVEIAGKKIYTIAEAAEMIGRSRETVLRWFRAGILPEVSRNKYKHREFTDDDIATLIKVRDMLLENIPTRKGGGK